MTPQEKDNWLIERLKRLDQWLGEKLLGGFKGTANFKGELKMKVIRANPTCITKISDFIRGFK